MAMAAPCDRSPRRAVCAASQVACAAYSMFLHGAGEPRWWVPSSAVYAACFQIGPKRRATRWPGKAHADDVPLPQHPPIDQPS